MKAKTAGRTRGGAYEVRPDAEAGRVGRCVMRRGAARLGCWLLLQLLVLVGHAVGACPRAFIEPLILVTCDSHCEVYPREKAIIFCKTG